jgi:Zn-dependent protease with chaperone function
MSPAEHTQYTRKTYPYISSRAWEHPADRAALATLQKLPGIDTLLQKFIGVTSEKSFRLMYLASSVRVSTRQFPRIHALLREACRILDVTDIPELYISHNPFFNAGAIGVEQPLLVLNSSVLETLTEEELLCVIGHELGHCLSGHALYKTLLQVLLKASLLAFQIPLGGAAVLGIIIALMEWNRKSELSADRAGLLVVQDPTVSYAVLMKMAGGAQSTQMDVNEFFAQATEYASGGTRLDGIHKLLNLLFVSHPFPVIRLTELQSWIDSGAYSAILAGQYPRHEGKSRPGSHTILEQLKEASASYKDQFEQSKDTFAGVVSELLHNVDALRQSAFQGIEALFDTEATPPPSTGEESTTGDAEGEAILHMLERLGELKERGIISEEEFAQQKAKLLSRL